MPHSVDKREVTTGDQVSGHDAATRIFGPFFETSPHPMVVYDELARVVAVNHAYEAFFQRPRHELIGRLPDESRYSILDDGRDFADILYGDAMSGSTEIEVYRPDGTVAYASVSVLVLREGGSISFFGLQITDITALRAGRDDLRRRLDVAGAIRRAATELADRGREAFNAIVEHLVADVMDIGGFTTVAVSRSAGAGRLAQTTAQRAADGVTVHTLIVATGEAADAHGLETTSLGDGNGWLGIDHGSATIGDWWPPAQASLVTFLEQAIRRVELEYQDHRRMRLQAFVNETAERYLAHEQTVDLDDVLGHTLEGLGHLLEADNVQFRRVDWEQMVSAISAEYTAEGHSPTEADFRELDLNEAIYGDIVARHEPFSFEIDGYHGMVSVLNVPLVVHATTTATLNVSSMRARQWEPAEIEACRSIAGLMVQLQRRNELEESLADRLRLGQLVNRVATECNEASADTEQQTIEYAVEALATALDSPRIAVWNHDVGAGRAELQWMWEHGVGATSLAGVVRIEIADHPGTRELFESVDARALTPDLIPEGFGDIPVDLHLLYVPVAQQGRAKTALSIESWGPRHWTPAEVSTAQAVAQLLAQLRARVAAEAAMVRRLAVEDATRAIATEMLRLSGSTSVRGIADSLGLMGEELALSEVSLWTIDDSAGVVERRAAWTRNGGVDVTTVRATAPPVPIEAERQQLPDLADQPFTGDLLVVPLTAGRDETQGLLVLGRDDGQDWTTEDQRAGEVLGTLLVQLGARLSAENHFATAFENAPVGISLRDGAGRLLACNPAYEQFVGRSQESLLGTDPDLLAPQFTNPSDRTEFRLERPDGTEVWGRITEAQAADTGNDGGLFLRHITDITATRQAMAQLEYQAGHDELTGLTNRRVLMERLEACLGPEARPTDAAVLLLDIDRFKVINDSLGHSVGDDVLRTVADRLRLAVRPQDTVCRLGGDEFVVLLPGPVEGMEATAVASRLLDMLADPIDVGPTSASLSASIGIATPTPDDATLEDVLRHADAAMYMAKNRGRNRWEVFDQRHRAALAHRLELEADLRRAVSDGALTLHYQPEFELDTGEMVGAEALVRWPHARFGLLAAGSFITVAEDTGQIVELGRQVLGMACRQAARWNARRSSPLVVRVNLSAHQLDRRELVDEVRHALAQSGLAPEQLCLEITETAIMADVDESMGLLEELRAVGVRLAVDDFGTGFSSLAYLKRFPVDILKIDQTFVRGLGCDRDDEAIVRSVLSMARALDLDVVAEGIETTAQRDMLIEMGCRRGQGFGLGRPCPPEELEPAVVAEPAVGSPRPMVS